MWNKQYVLFTEENITNKNAHSERFYLLFLLLNHCQNIRQIDCYLHCFIVFLPINRTRYYSAFSFSFYASHTDPFPNLRFLFFTIPAISSTSRPIKVNKMAYAVKMMPFGFLSTAEIVASCSTTFLSFACA